MSVNGPSTGPDYVALIATAVLGITACVALYLNQETVAGTAVGAVAGYIYRINGR